MQRRQNEIVLCGVLIFVVFGIYHRVFHLQLLGADTYPTIIASRVQNWHDFAGTFTEPLMDGRYPFGYFFRPVLNLSFATDYFFSGLNPFGYHFSTLFLFSICAVLLFLFCRKFLDSTLSAFLAALFFILHPSVFSVLPAPPRRAEFLPLLFGFAALLSLPVRKSEQNHFRTLAAMICVLLALYSKETGSIVIALIPLHQLLFRESDNRKYAIRYLAFIVPLFLFYLVHRSVVIYHATHQGSWLGGHEHRLSLADVVQNIFEFLPLYIQGIFRSAALAIAFALLAVLSGIRYRMRAARVIWIGFYIASSTVLVNSFAGEFHQRYGLPVVAGVAVMLAGIIETTLPMARWKGFVTSAVLALIVGTCLFTFFQIMKSDPWPAVSARQKAYFDSLPQYSQIPPPPGYPSDLCKGPVCPELAGLGSYSVQAWLDLNQ